MVLGPKQLKSMTFLTFSSRDLFIWLPMAEEEEAEIFLAW